MVTGLRKIESTEAVLKTASVEVKTLTLKGKQMTLSVFRQLQKGTLIDPTTLKLNGVPWGKVNYFWGDCMPNHLHIVWQLGNELRRDCIYEKWPEWRETELEYNKAKNILSHTTYAVILLKTFRTDAVLKEEKISVNFPSGSWSASVTDNVLANAKRKWEYLTTHDNSAFNRDVRLSEWDREAKNETPLSPEVQEQKIREFLQNKIKDDLWKFLSYLGFEVGQYPYNWKVPDILDAEDIKRQCIKAEASYVEAKDRLGWCPKQWGEHYAALAALDQLFIAI